jgi:hypothetical protein
MGTFGQYKESKKQSIDAKPPQPKLVPPIFNQGQILPKQQKDANMSGK